MVTGLVNIATRKPFAKWKYLTIFLIFIEANHLWQLCENSSYGDHLTFSAANRFETSLKELQLGRAEIARILKEAEFYWCQQLFAHLSVSLAVGRGN